jgi:hypothetical protein
VRAHKDRIGSFSAISMTDDVARTYDELVSRGVEFARPAAIGGVGLVRDLQGPGRELVCVGVEVEAYQKPGRAP